MTYNCIIRSCRIKCNIFLSTTAWLSHLRNKLRVYPNTLLPFVSHPLQRQLAHKHTVSSLPNILTPVPSLPRSLSFSLSLSVSPQQHELFLLAPYHTEIHSLFLTDSLCSLFLSQTQLLPFLSSLSLSFSHSLSLWTFYIIISFPLFLYRLFVSLSKTRVFTLFYLSHSLAYLLSPTLSQSHVRSTSLSHTHIENTQLEKNIKQCRLIQRWTDCSSLNLPPDSIVRHWGISFINVS
jgi:hypothetical protein